METIKINIPKGSKTATAFKKYMAEKEAFKKAVITGKGTDYVKKHTPKIATSL